jgi:hypothetical protein
MTHNLEDNENIGTLIQGCTIRKSKIKNNENLYELTCLTCNQKGYYATEYELGKATGAHFADKYKFPIG